MGIQKTKIEVTPEVTRQIAMRKAIGTSLRELETEFGFSRPVINRVLSSELAKSVIKGVIDDAVAGAVISIRRRLADMTDIAMSALEHNLKEQNLEAVKIFFKGLGMDAVEKEVRNQSQGITVILPGQKAPKDIDVSND